MEGLVKKKIFNVKDTYKIYL